MPDETPEPRGDMPPLEIALDAEAPAGEKRPTPAAEALVVELDPEGEAPAAPADAPPTGLVVELDDTEGDAPAAAADTIDLSDADFSQEPAPLPGLRGGAPGAGDLMGKKGAPTTAQTMARSSVLALTVAGLIGGLLAWLITEGVLALQGPPARDLWANVSQVAIYGLCAGLALGASLGAAEGVSLGIASRALRGAGWGLLFGAVGGLLGGGLGQLTYGGVNDYLAAGNMRLNPFGSVLIYATGWSVMGVFFGIGQGALVPAAAKMRNGILGGAIGGLLGGVAFSLIKAGMAQQATVGRLLALVAMGIAIGLLIGLIEEAAKEAWVRVIAGPLSGKQFILYEGCTAIGSSPRCGIILFKDPEVATEHAEIQNQQTVFVLVHLAQGGTTAVNGRPTHRHMLEDGDVITLGMSQLEFHETARQGKGQGADKVPGVG